MSSPLDQLKTRMNDAEGLMACVHCGFCLPACPTYARLGDEADSPRGRLHLMRAVAEGRLDPSADAFQVHMDRCLGCRACEPVCPSGVPYGELLEEARAVAIEARPLTLMPRLLLMTFGSRVLSGLMGISGRWMRDTPLARLGARWAPSRTLRTAMAMLAATRSGWRRRVAPAEEGSSEGFSITRVGPDSLATLVSLDGCVQRGLYGRVNEATERVLEANGFSIAEWGGSGCCGALHAHAGRLDDARDLARKNIAAFERGPASGIAVNAAGCGAAMKAYGELLRFDPEWAERAEQFSSSVKDVSEWLAEAGPRRGAELRATVAYDPPCHLVHAQGVHAQVEAVLDAIPGLERRPVQKATECCGGAGIYAMTHPELGGQIGRDKVANVRGSGAGICATGNPGCMMQIGAGLRAEDADMEVAHPVELLDESYRRAGYYRSSNRGTKGAK